MAMDADQKEVVFCSQPELVDLFPSYIIGDVEADEREKIEEHLAVCDECQRELRFFLNLHKVGEEVLRTK
jgi:hypothetical protein